MSTMTTTKTETRTVTGTDVREVATAMWAEIQSIFEVYGKHFPYNPQALRGDLGQILLWDMAAKIRVQFYDHEKVERLSYEFVPQADTGVAASPPGEFPHFLLPASYKVRVTAVPTTAKPAPEVEAFYEALGWRPSEPLTRTGQGTTEQYGEIRSGGFGVNREVYKDLPDTTQTTNKELER